MASGIYLNDSVWSSPLVGYNKKQTEGSWTYIGRNVARSCYQQKFRSYYQITTRPCHPEEEQQQQQKGEMQFFENIFSLDFF